ncbi:MAG: glycosyltransferase 87 family protein [Solirubrobacterales bacterium]
MAVPLAAPGTVVVPGALGEGPGWLLGPYGSGFGLSGPVYYACLWVALIASVVIWRSAPALGPRLVWSAIGLAIALFALAPPLLSQDAFSYISYARMSELHAANPYETAPVAFPGDAAFPYVGWIFAPSAYGPAFTIATRPLGSIALPEAFWILKSAAALGAAGVAALSAAVARRRGVDPVAAASFVALNPIVLVDVVGGAHNDALMMLAAMAGVLAMLAGRQATSGAAFATAAAIKITGGLAAPFALAGAARGHPRLRLALGAILALVVVVAATLPLYGHGALDSLALLGDNQDLTTRLSLPRILSNLPLVSIGVARAVTLGAYAVMVGWLLIWTWRGGDWVRAAGWAGLGLLLATSWVLPWYLLWVLPLAAVSGDGRLQTATLTLCGLQLAYGIPA